MKDVCFGAECEKALLRSVDVADPVELGDVERLAPDREQVIPWDAMVKRREVSHFVLLSLSMERKIGFQVRYQIAFYSDLKGTNSSAELGISKFSYQFFGVGLGKALLLELRVVGEGTRQFALRS